MTKKKGDDDKDTTTTSPENQNQLLNSEKSIISNLLTSALEGNGPKIETIVLNYSENHADTKPLDVLSQFKDAKKRTVMHFACMSPPNDKEDVIEFLLSRPWLSSSPSTALEEILRAKDSEGLSPLMLASQHCNHKRIALLLQKEPKLAFARSRIGATALHYAAGAGADREIILTLYNSAKVALNTPSKQGGTPLHWAAPGSSSNHDRDYVVTMAALLECGANIDAKNEQGLSPLILAAAAGNDANASFLAQKGADKTIQIPGGLTVFHMAADLNLVQMLKSLLDEEWVQKCQTLKNEKGETPLDLAVMEGHEECVKLLLPSGDDSEENVKDYIVKKKAELQTLTKSDADTSTNKSDGNATDEASSALSECNITDRIEQKAKNHASEILTKYPPDLNDNDIKKQKKEALEHKLQGNKAYAKEDWTDAIQSYTLAISAYPSDATFYSNRSACFMNLHNYTEALEDAMMARVLNPTWPKAAFRLATARLALERYEDAAVAAWEGVQLDPGSDELKRLLQQCVNEGKKAHQEKLLAAGGEKEEEASDLR